MNKYTTSLIGNPSKLFDMDKEYFENTTYIINLIKNIIKYNRLNIDTVNNTIAQFYRESLQSTYLDELSDLITNQSIIKIQNMINNFYIPYISLLNNDIKLSKFRSYIDTDNIYNIIMSILIGYFYDENQHKNIINYLEYNLDSFNFNNIKEIMTLYYIIFKRVENHYSFNKFNYFDNIHPQNYRNILDLQNLFILVNTFNGDINRFFYDNSDIITIFLTILNKKLYPSRLIFPIEELSYNINYIINNPKPFTQEDYITINNVIKDTIKKNNRKVRGNNKRRVSNLKNEYVNNHYMNKVELSINIYNAYQRFFKDIIHILNFKKYPVPMKDENLPNPYLFIFTNPNLYYLLIIELVIDNHLLEENTVSEPLISLLFILFNCYSNMMDILHGFIDKIKNNNNIYLYDDINSTYEDLFQYNLCNIDNMNDYIIGLTTLYNNFSYLNSKFIQSFKR